MGFRHSKREKTSKSGNLEILSLHSKREKTSKSGILEIIPSWYILSLKPKGKGDCKYLIHFSSGSCLFIFFNPYDEFGSYIIFSTG